MKYLKNIQIRSTNEDDDENDGEEGDEDDEGAYDRGQTAKGISHSKISQLLKIEREKLQGKYFKYVPYTSYRYAYMHVYVYGHGYVYVLTVNLCTSLYFLLCTDCSTY